MSKVNDQKWWCENLFTNGDFADTAKNYLPVGYPTNAGGYRTYMGDVNTPCLLSLFGQYFYWIYYDVSQNNWNNNRLLFSVDPIPCKANTEYTISWWEHLESNIPLYNSGNSKIFYRSGNTIISQPLLPSYDSVIDFTPHKWYKKSVTITTPAGCNNFYFQLGLKILNTTNIIDPFMHIAYDGVLVCEGNNKVPYTWVDKTDGLTNVNDYVYWKTLDKLNQLHDDIKSGIALRASVQNFGTVNLQNNGDFLVNNVGQLELNSYIVKELSQAHALVSVPPNEVSNVLNRPGTELLSI